MPRHHKEPLHMVSLAIDASRHFLAIRLGRYEFFAQRKASPFYCDPCFQRDGKSPTFFCASDYGGHGRGSVEHILVVPLVSLHLIKYGL
jgi:hypothetical protein